MPTIKEMRAVCQQRRPNAKGKMVWVGHWFNRLVNRHFSIYFTWLFVKLNVSANQVSLLMILTSLAGTALCIPHLLWPNIIGMFLLMFAEVLDCVDGEVARWTKKSSIKGLYLDLVFHVFCDAPVVAICALHLYVLTRQDKYLVLAFLGYVMAQIKLGLAAVYQRVVTQIVESDSTNKDRLQSSASSLRQPTLKSKLFAAAKWLIHMSFDGIVIRFALIIAILLGYAGFIMPMVFLSWWFVIFGLINNVGEIVNKYYACMPDAYGHVGADVNVIVSKYYVGMPDARHINKV
jgi:phosphatidylglycerophosphate synthase